MKNETNLTDNHELAREFFAVCAAIRDIPAITTDDDCAGSLAAEEAVKAFTEFVGHYTATDEKTISSVRTAMAKEEQPRD